MKKINKESLTTIIGFLLFAFIMVGVIFTYANLIIPYAIIFFSVGLALLIPFMVLLLKGREAKGFSKKVKTTKNKIIGPEDEVVDYVNGEKEFHELSSDAKVEYFEEWIDD